MTVKLARRRCTILELSWSGFIHSKVSDTPLRGYPVVVTLVREPNEELWGLSNRFIDIEASLSRTF